MERRAFLKGSAIIGASIVAPNILKASSGMSDSKSGRRVVQVISAQRSMVGTLPVLRAFAGDHNDYVSPYVFLDEFGPVKVNPKDKPLRVDAHPHAGIIPTTYFLEGNGHHRDSLQYDFQISKGDFMMFTSGRGAIHMEETGNQLFQQGGIYHGFQIWLNMPSKHKFIAPSTELFHPDKMAELKGENYEVKIVLGEMNGAKSSVECLFPVFYYHFTAKKGTKLNIPVDPKHNAFIYVISGQLETEERRAINTNQVALYEREKDTINIFCQEDASFLMLGGQPHNEVVYAYGPFVMTNESEIRSCINDYQSGKMGNPDLVNNGFPLNHH